MRVLVGYDKSECADNAVADLASAGIPDGSEVRIVTVSDWFPVPVAVGGAEVLAAQPVGDVEGAESIAKAGADIISSEHPGWDVKFEGHIGSPAHEILRRATEWNADLIVVGSHGYGKLGRLFMGSVSQQILHGADRSVRIARSPKKEKPTGAGVTILAGIDGSIYTEAIVDTLVARAWPENSNVVLVTSSEYSYDAQESKKIHAELQELHEKVSKQLGDAGLPCTSIINTDMVHPRELILDEAEKNNVDVIFIGARGLTGFERFVLGSVSAAVALRSDRTVEVVHREPGDVVRD
jgi:nucleotide-binding universal stress UspA family protein